MFLKKRICKQFKEENDVEAWRRNADEMPRDSECRKQVELFYDHPVKLVCKRINLNIEKIINLAVDKKLDRTCKKYCSCEKDVSLISENVISSTTESSVNLISEKFDNLPSEPTNNLISDTIVSLALKNDVNLNNGRIVNLESEKSACLSSKNIADLTFQEGVNVNSEKIVDVACEKNFNITNENEVSPVCELTTSETYDLVLSVLRANFPNLDRGNETDLASDNNFNLVCENVTTFKSGDNPNLSRKSVINFCSEKSADVTRVNVMNFSSENSTNLTFGNATTLKQENSFYLNSEKVTNLMYEDNSKPTCENVSRSDCKNSPNGTFEKAIKGDTNLPAKSFDDGMVIYPNVEKILKYEIKVEKDNKFPILKSILTGERNTKKGNNSNLTRGNVCSSEYQNISYSTSKKSIKNDNLPGTMIVNNGNEIYPGVESFLEYKIKAYKDYEYPVIRSILNGERSTEDLNNSNTTSENVGTNNPYQNHEEAINLSSKTNANQNFAKIIDDGMVIYPSVGSFLEYKITAEKDSKYPILRSILTRKRNVEESNKKTVRFNKLKYFDDGETNTDEAFRKERTGRHHFSGIKKKMKKKL